MVFLVFALLFMTGAAVGSFLNVVITRSIAGEQWKTGRSHCDSCGQVLAWYDMIPVLSYMAYRGRARCCSAPLSIQHPVVETLMGSLFVWWYFVGSLFFRLVSHPLSIVQPGFWLMTGIILLVISITDLFYGLIPTMFVSIGVGMTALYRVVLATHGAYQWNDLISALLSGAGAWGFFWLLRQGTRGKGMGDGDVILAFYLGFLMGWPKTFVGMLASFILGAVISLFLIALRSKKMSSTVPFGPFMVAGTVVGLLWGNDVMHLLGF